MADLSRNEIVKMILTTEKNSLDLSNLDLSNLDLSYLNLSNVKIHNSNLTNSKFHKTNLTKASIRECDVLGVIFDKCVIEYPSSKRIYDDIQFMDTKFDRLNFSENEIVELSNSDIIICEFKGNSKMSFINCRFNGSNFKDLEWTSSKTSSSFNDLSFSKVIFRNEFDESYFYDLFFSSCQFKNTLFSRCKFKDIGFGGHGELSKRQEEKSPLIFDRPIFYECQFEGQLSFYKETYVSQYEKNTFLDKIKSQTQDSETKKCLEKYFVSDISIDIDDDKFFLIKEIESIVSY